MIIVELALDTGFTVFNHNAAFRNSWN